MTKSRSLSPQEMRDIESFVEKNLNPYRVLNISPDSTPDDIKKAFKEKVPSSHPDHEGKSDAFNNLLMARNILVNSVALEFYEQELAKKNKAPIPIQPKQEVKADISLAVANGDEKLIRTLLEAKADVVTPNPPLMFVAACHNRPEVIRLLYDTKDESLQKQINQIFKVKNHYHNGNSLVHIAATNYLYPNGVYGSDPHAESKSEREARMSNALALIDVLIECKANLDQKNKKGETPLFLATNGMDNHNPLSSKLACHGADLVAGGSAMNRNYLKHIGLSLIAEDPKKHAQEAVELLMLREDDADNSLAKRFVKSRESLTEAFIELHKNKRPEEKETALRSLLGLDEKQTGKKNLLGRILSEENWKHKMSRKLGNYNYKGTEKIARIKKALGYDPSQPGLVKLAEKEEKASLRKAYKEPQRTIPEKEADKNPDVKVEQKGPRLG